MSFWRRKTSKPPPTLADLEQRLTTIRPDGTTDQPLADEEVTGVIDLALEKMIVASQLEVSRLEHATDLLREETDALTQKSLTKETR
jgi:hypothetical protein